MTVVPYLLKLPRPAKLALAMLVDAATCAVSVWAAFYLRLGEISGYTNGLRIATAAAIVLALPIFFAVGLYRTIIRFSDGITLLRVTQGCFVFGVLYSSIFAVMGIPGVPRTVGLIEPILLLLVVGLSRSTAAYWFGQARRARPSGDTANVVIYGAGAAGQQLSRAISHSVAIRVVAFLDDSPNLQGRKLGSISVYPPSALDELIFSHNVTEVLLAFPSVSRGRRNAIIKSLYGHDVRVRTLPGLMDLAHGRVEVTDIRPLEIEDLLGRDVVAPDAELLKRNIAGKTVLVSGAGGSIGSELCRQIIKVEPAALLLLESSEFALYSVHQELSEWAARENASFPIVPLLGSVRDATRVRAIFEAWRPDTVYHAAAYKHVPLVEHNAVEGIRNNVQGTIVIAQAARDFQVRDFVLISTDKAVRPTNIMGATKRLAEMVLQSLADERDGHTTFAMVRFGNVLGSSGSVVPLFRQQIEQGGPITITHADITRYFMTIPEAAQLVIQAGAMARGGEVFVLDMGEPVRIRDLAKNMIELSGLTVRSLTSPDGDIEIETVGLRPGEKLYEELLIGDNPERTSHAKIMKANEKYLGWSELRVALDELDQTLATGDVVRLKVQLQALVPEFASSSDLVDWVALKRDA